uniref:Secreted protein n=1 Tax=Opuntia streptacantha TaxID=393608 RepID=A0A7C9CV41_OPUST
MGLHLVAVVAALHFPRGGAAPTIQIASSLLLPFVLRVCLSLRIVHRDVVCSSRLFLFQVTQILAGFDHNDRDHQYNNQTANSGRNRWHRVLRLVRQRADQVRRVLMGPIPRDQDEDSLHLLSMLAL